MTDPIDQFNQAARLGPLARLRLRAEVLLHHAADGLIPLTEVEADARKWQCRTPLLVDASTQYVVRSCVDIKKRGYGSARCTRSPEGVGWIIQEHRVCRKALRRWW
jgi:hypothetical protein